MTFKCLYRNPPHLPHTHHSTVRGSRLWRPVRGTNLLVGIWWSRSLRKSIFFDGVSSWLYVQGWDTGHGRFVKWDLYISNLVTGVKFFLNTGAPFLVNRFQWQPVYLDRKLRSVGLRSWTREFGYQGFSVMHPGTYVSTQAFEWESTYRVLWPVHVFMSTMSKDLLPRLSRDSWWTRLTTRK